MNHSINLNKAFSALPAIDRLLSEEMPSNLSYMLVDVRRQIDHARENFTQWHDKLLQQCDGKPLPNSQGIDIPTPEKRQYYNEQLAQLLNDGQVELKVSTKVPLTVIMENPANGNQRNIPGSIFLLLDFLIDDDSKKALPDDEKDVDKLRAVS